MSTKLASAIAADILRDRSVIRSECLMCARSVDQVKATKFGGRHRFCSERCIQYFDAGWSASRGPKVSGAITTFSPVKSASGRSRSEAQKQRQRLLRKKAFADSWKKYQAKNRDAANPEPQ